MMQWHVGGPCQSVFQRIHNMRLTWFHLGEGRGMRAWKRGGTHHTLRSKKVEAEKDRRGGERDKEMLSRNTWASYKNGAGICFVDLGMVR